MLLSRTLFLENIRRSNVKPYLKEYAEKTLNKIYAQYERAREKRAAKYEMQNRPLMVDICRYLACKRDTPAKAIAQHYDLSVQKTVALLKKLAYNDRLVIISRHYKSRNTYNLIEGITFLR